MTDNGGTAKPQPQPYQRPARKIIVVSPRVHAELTRVKGLITADLERAIDFSETIERLIEHWERT